jgi:hypothetical protein
MFEISQFELISQEFRVLRCISIPSHTMFRQLTILALAMLVANAQVVKRADTNTAHMRPVRELQSNP